MISELSNWDFLIMHLSTNDPDLYAMMRGLREFSDFGWNGITKSRLEDDFGTQ